MNAREYTHPPPSQGVTSSGQLILQLSGPELAGNDQAEPDTEDPTMEWVVPNLTPDPETGHIASWSEEQFVQRFRAGRVLRTSKMPWEAYREMTDSDLRSVYRYLKTVPPAKKAIGPAFRKVAGQSAKPAGTQQRPE